MYLQLPVFLYIKSTNLESCGFNFLKKVFLLVAKMLRFFKIRSTEVFFYSEFCLSVDIKYF